MKQIFLLAILFVVSLGQNTSQSMDTMAQNTSQSTGTMAQNTSQSMDAMTNATNPETDGDGVGANGDAFPKDHLESTDTDGDGVGDNADAFPNDPDKSEEESSTSGVGIIILVVFGCGFIYLAIYYVGWRRRRSNGYASLPVSVPSSEDGGTAGEFVQPSIIF